MNKKIDEPFDKEILKKASDLAQKYHIEIKSSTRLGFIGNCVEIPTVFFDGKTEKKCEEQGRKAITVTIAFMLESGRELPKIKEK